MSLVWYHMPCEMKRFIRNEAWQCYRIILASYIIGPIGIRKMHTAGRMVTWQMTSRDPERSRSWPWYVWALISRNLLEIKCRFQRIGATVVSLWVTETGALLLWRVCGVSTGSWSVWCMQTCTRWPILCRWMSNIQVRQCQWHLPTMSSKLHRISGMYRTVGHCRSWSM